MTDKYSQIKFKLERPTTLARNMPMVLRWLILIYLMLIGWGTARAAERAVESGKGGAGSNIFGTNIKPLLNHYCYGCHGEKKKGDLDLRIYADELSVKRDAQVFEKVLDKLQSREMPPENKPQPTSAERKLIAGWIESSVLGCDCNHPDPGRVTIRRLNRAEYNHTIHDLMGIDFQPADDFPADDVGYGFDNIGDVLSLSPMLMEKYMTAAGKILDLAMAAPAELQPWTESYRRIFIRQPTPQTKDETAREIIGNFARRAYRRPVTPDEVERLFQIFQMVQKDGGSFESGIKLALQAVLVSPNFLFRGELQPEPDNPKSIHEVNDYALASRLSYFLWSTMPDDELFAQAAKGTLRRNLESEVKRMLKDPKAHALVENFADQWLQIRNLAMMTPDKEAFPEFDEELRSAMAGETERFFEYIMKQNRSVLEFINADYTFLNERLARHYRIKGVVGGGFQRVSLKGTQRGGLLTQASILTITSTPTRTSPVKRGKWVLENILGTPPPPAPPGVPVLKEEKGAALTGTMRQRMEQHRVDPVCASCHARMDPIGFGFENYDGIGAWRIKDGEFPIDASGKLFSGESFDGAGGLKTILLKRKQDQFVRCLSEKMLTYALGRGLERYDKCAIDKIVKNLGRNGYRFSTLVMEVVQSVPFEQRRGEGGAQMTNDK